MKPVIWRQFDMVLRMSIFENFNFSNNEFWAFIFAEGVVPLSQIFLVLVLAVISSKLLRRLSKRGIYRITSMQDANGARADQRAKALTALSHSVISVTIWTIAILTALGSLGINLGPLVAGAGIAGVALGFGAQSLVKDFLSGISMLIEDQYGVGDIVDVGGTIGEVESISLRSTRLRGIDGTAWHIPNGEINKVGNLSQDWSRIVLDISVAYKSDLTFTQQEIAKVLENFSQDPSYKDNLLEDPEILGVQSLSDNSIEIRVSIKVKAGTQWELTRKLREKIKNHFDETAIEIPFPQLSVWIEKTK